MEVFRITTAKWSNSLTGSGFPARWNSRGKFMVYTSSSRALASLENVVHRSGEGLNSLFKVMIIEIPSIIKIDNIDINTLPKNWFDFKNYSDCQLIGDKWIDSYSSAVLRVPSAIIKREFNYLLNPNHTLFKKIKIATTEDFEFDPRLKND